MDAYDIQARQAPVVFVVLPLVLVALSLVPSLGKAKIQVGGIGFLLLVNLGFVATRLARSAGRARQDRLYASWGGTPTTVMLRFSDNRLNPQTKRVYRGRLSHLGSEFPIPDEEEERRDPAGADIKVAAAVGEVRERAKKKRIKALHRENINYGSSRNAYGLKPLGLASCLISAGALTLAISLRKQPVPNGLDITVGMAILAIGGTWLLACTANRVRHHGEAYALALFEAINDVVHQQDGSQHARPLQRHEIQLNEP